LPFLKFSQIQNRIFDKPIKSTLPTQLYSIPEPNAEILGDGDIYAQAGSPLNITCVVNYLPQESDEIRWLHEGQVDKNRFLYAILFRKHMIWWG